MKKNTIIIISLSSLLLVAALGYLIYTRTRSQRIDKANPIDGFNKFMSKYEMGDRVPELYNQIVKEKLEEMSEKNQLPLSTSDPHIRGMLWNNNKNFALSYG